MAILTTLCPNDANYIGTLNIFPATNYPCGYASGNLGSQSTATYGFNATAPCSGNFNFIVTAASTEATINGAIRLVVNGTTYTTTTLLVGGAGITTVTFPNIPFTTSGTVYVEHDGDGTANYANIVIGQIQIDGECITPPTSPPTTPPTEPPIEKPILTSTEICSTESVNLRTISGTTTIQEGVILLYAAPYTVGDAPIATGVISNGTWIIKSEDIDTSTEYIVRGVELTN